MIELFKNTEKLIEKKSTQNFKLITIYFKKMRLHPLAII
jgi:hypothetical protein